MSLLEGLQQVIEDMPPWLQILLMAGSILLIAFCIGYAVGRS